MKYLCMKIIKFGEGRVQIKEIAKFSLEIDALNFAESRQTNDVFVINCNDAEISWIASPKIKELEHN